MSLDKRVYMSPKLDDKDKYVEKVYRKANITFLLEYRGKYDPFPIKKRSEEHMLVFYCHFFWIKTIIH